VSTDQHTEIDPDKLMQFVFRAVGEVGATLNAALVVMGDKLGPATIHRMPRLRLPSSRTYKFGGQGRGRTADGLMVGLSIGSATSPVSSACDSAMRSIQEIWNAN
jgi:hypothetical protein